MTGYSSLDMTLEHLGYAPRPQQQRLYEALLHADRNGVIVQAGTGTGKSLGVLAAAADWIRRSGGLAQPDEGDQVVVVTPTKVLQDQYMAKDAPAIMAATGLRIVSLKGRKSYVCYASPGMRNPRIGDEELDAARYAEHGPAYPGDPLLETSNPRFGCPGKKRHRTDDEICYATMAREAALSADIVITNLHILIFDDMLKGGADGENDGILPHYGLLLVDEAHKVEETVRGFTTLTLSKRMLDKVLNRDRAMPLLEMLRNADEVWKMEQGLPPNPVLIQALVDLTLAKSDDDDEEPDEEDDITAAAAARAIVEAGKAGHIGTNAILHFIPTPRNAPTPNPKLALTWINLGGRCNSLLTKTSVALVSATIPTTLRQSLGLPNARMLDVGHPFDYARQATLAISSHGGGFREAQNTFHARCRELLDAIRATPGGALVLFSAFTDLRKVHDELERDLVADGRLVLAQRDEADKAALARDFLADGRAVLFGSESFATGFDAPGDALTLVALWKLPYPGLSPVTRAIGDQNRRRYEDMMRVSAAQALGRLIRTETDRGHALILDSRGTKLLDPSDPMLAHLLQFRRVS